MQSIRRNPRRARPLESLHSILVVVDRSDADRGVLLRSVVIARHFGAALTLFLCDAEHAFWLRHAYCPEGVSEARARRLEDARQYLQALRNEMHDSSVPISISVAVESPLHEGIVRRVLGSDFDLVVKAPGGRVFDGMRTLDESDRQLIRTCPVPLLLTRGRPWRPVPRIAAAVDVSEGETASLRATVAQAAEFLAGGCHGKTHLIFGECSVDPILCRRHAEELHDLACRSGVDADCIHVLGGDPVEVILPFAAAQVFDVVVLGALSHETKPAGQVGTLTGQMLDSIGSDFLIVKPASHVSPLSRRATSGGPQAIREQRR